MRPSRSCASSGAVGPDGLATDLGKTLARIPADPRLARALLDGAAAVGHRTAAEAVAVVAGDQRAPGADLTRLLAALRSGKDPAARRWTEDVRRMEAIVRKEDAAVVPFPSRSAGDRRGGRRVRRRASRSRTGWRAASRGRGGALPAVLRHPGRASGRQPAGRARVAGSRGGLARGRPRCGRHRRRHPLRGAADGGHGGGRRPAPADGNRGSRVQPGPGHGPPGTPAGSDRAVLDAGAAVGRGGTGRGGPRAGQGRAGNHRMVDGGGRLAPPSRPAAPGTGRAVAGRFRAGAAGPA